jgi:rRNA maturation protein Nop10
MKIIKRGEIPADAPHRATCRTCKSELEFTMRETTTESFVRPGEEPYTWIKCPVCGGQVGVS